MYKTAMTQADVQNIELEMSRRTPSKTVSAASKIMNRPSVVDKVPAASKPLIGTRPLFKDPLANTNTKRKELVSTRPTIKKLSASRTAQPADTAEADAKRKRNIMIVVVLLAVVAIVLFIYKRKKRNAKKG